MPDHEDDEKDELDDVETISREQALKEMQLAIRNLRKHEQTDNIHPSRKNQKNALRNSLKDKPADTKKAPGEPGKTKFSLSLPYSYCVESSQTLWSRLIICAILNSRTYASNIMSCYCVRYSHKYF